jgi:hypothetical protein
MLRKPTSSGHLHRNVTKASIEGSIAALQPTLVQTNCSVLEIQQYANPSLLSRSVLRPVGVKVRNASISLADKKHYNTTVCPG